MLLFRRSFALLLACLSIGRLPAADPILLFKKDDIASLQEKVKEPQYADLWKEVLAEADRYCNPKSQDYADLETAYKKAKGTSPHAYARKMSEWLEALGTAYLLTGDAKYAEQGKRILQIAATPELTADVMKNIFPGTRGDMMRSLAIGLDMLSDSITTEERAPIVATARQYIDSHIAEYHVEGGPWLTTRVRHNFTGVCGGGLGMLAIALRDDFPDETPKWTKLAETMITNWLAEGFDSDGAYREGVLYMRYGLANPSIFMEAQYRWNKSKTLLEHPTLRKIPSYLALEMLPGESTFDARNDSLYDVDLGGKGGSGAPFLLLLASGFRGAIAPDPLAGWLWQKTGSEYSLPFQIVWATPHEEKSPAEVLEKPYGEEFGGTGLCVWRTGWSLEDVMFSIQAGPYTPITHAQADIGHFSLYGYGYRWAADTGYGNNSEPIGRSQTDSHNCVLVDGRGQALSGAGRGVNGKILAYKNDARYGYALVDAQEAYAKNDKGTPGITLNKALRHSFFFRPADNVPAYAVVLDDIEESGQKHNFAWQLVTWENMAVNTDGSGKFTVKPPKSTKLKPYEMQVTVLGSAPLKSTSAPYSPDALKNRGPNEYQRLRVEIEAENPRFAAILAPIQAGTEPPKATMVTENGASILEIKWPGRTDRIAWQGPEAKLLDLNSAHVSSSPKE